MESLDLKWIRGQFPALNQTVNGQTAIFFDGTGGTQVPGAVLDAISDYLVRSNANAHGAFATSARTDAVIAAARVAIADFLDCSSDEVVFGANMTTLTFLVAAMSAIQQYERELSHQLISGLLEIPGLSIYGITESNRFNWRTPTVAIRIKGQSILDFRFAILD